MAAARGLTMRRERRPLLAGVGSRDGGLPLLANFPDLDRVAPERGRESARTGDREDDVDPDDSPSKPRVGWGSVGILAVVAAAVCIASWWVDRGPIDPGVAEIERARLAERADAKPETRVRTAVKLKKSMRR